MDIQNGTAIDLEEEYIVLSIPKDAVEVTIRAKVWHKGSVIEVEKTVDFDTIREMFKEADQGYIPENAIFTLTDKGKAYLEELKRKQLAGMEEDE